MDPVIYTDASWHKSMTNADQTYPHVTATLWSLWSSTWPLPDTPTLRVNEQGSINA